MNKTNVAFWLVICYNECNILNETIEVIIC